MAFTEIDFVATQAWTDVTVSHPELANVALIVQNNTSDPAEVFFSASATPPSDDPSYRMTGLSTKSGNAAHIWVKSLSQSSTLAFFPQASSANTVTQPALAALLSKWRKARGLVRSNQSVSVARVANVGDSKTRGAGPGAGAQKMDGAQPYSRPNRITALLSAAGFNVRDNTMFGYGGSTSPAGLVLYDARISNLTGWGGGVASLGGVVLRKNSAADPLIWTPKNFAGVAENVDTIDTYLQVLGTTCSMTIDRGAGVIATLTTPVSPLGVQKNTTSLGAAASTAINLIRTVGFLPLIGFSAYDSTKSAVEVANFGVYGCITAYQADNTSSAVAPALALATYAPDLTIINLGTNDLIAANSLANVIASLQIIISAAQISGDVILVWPSIGNVTSVGDVPTRAAWNAAYSALAQLNGCVFVDEEALLGGKVLASTNGAFGTDNLHELAWAYDLEAQNLVNLMLS